MHHRNQSINYFCDWNLEDVAEKSKNDDCVRLRFLTRHSFKQFSSKELAPMTVLLLVVAYAN